MKFTTSFPSLRFDGQPRNETAKSAKFVTNFGNFKRTSETVCKKFCETHGNLDVHNKQLLDEVEHDIMNYYTSDSL